MIYLENSTGSTLEREPKKCCKLARSNIPKNIIQKQKTGYVLIKKKKLTISNRTSPALYDSPSFFFQLASPPSVMVGLIAGMVNLDSAFRRAET